MNHNTSLNDNAAILRQKMSDAFNFAVLSAEGASGLTQVILTFSVLSTVAEPLPATCAMAERVTDTLLDELADSLDFGHQSYAVQWSPRTSDGLDLFRALQTLGVAELSARRLDMEVVLDAFSLEVSVRPFHCVCDEGSCGQKFHVLDDSDKILPYVHNILEEINTAGLGQTCPRIY